MSVRIDFLARAREKIRSDLLPQIEAELQRAFHDAQAVTVCACFQGYTNNQDEKIVLGVETRSKVAYRTHVVKLGSKDEVGRDYRGYRECVLKHGFASRIFLPVTQVVLSSKRVAVIYEDAYSYYDTGGSAR